LDLKLTQLSDLPASKVDDLLARLQDIPRPPRALDKLVSAEFMATASSSVLNDLMTGEPQITAKVLASVNSPLYGLQKPLGSVGQAVTYLGMNTVRGICMQYMLNDSFKAASPDLRIFYETTFEASACSSELCFKLAQLLQMPDPGSLVTQVVLSYLGPLATYSLLDKAVVISLAQSGPVERTRMEQEQLGLCAAEIGRLLMQTWKVPDGLIQDVRDIDKVMVTPFRAPVDIRSARLALCYLCNRLGMMIARGELVDLRSLDVTNSESIELFFFLGYLKHPSLARLTEFLRFPEVISCVDQMVARNRLRRQRTARSSGP
jgi:HD-like signal output (HDOD) protein